MLAIRTNAEKNGWKISAFDSRFECPNPAGYRDLKINLTSPDGHVCELIFNTTMNFLAKEHAPTSDGPGGRSLFDKLRPILEKAKAENRKLTAEEKAFVEPRLKECRALYAMYWQKSQEMPAVLNEGRENESL